MDNFEMVEKLVEKTGVSYADAKAALEASNWDMLDAVIALEQAGKTEQKSGSYTTGDAQNAQRIGSEQQIPSGDEKRGKSNRGGKLRDFFRKLENIFFNNKLIIRNNNGKKVLEAPVLIALIAFIISFWFSVILIIISLGKGWQYSFEGPDLGTESVNNAAGSVGNMVHDLGRELKEKCEANKAEHDNIAEQ